MQNNNDTIGVLDYSAPQRTVRDQSLQDEFGWGTKELYSNEVVNARDFGPRSLKDKLMQMQFNPRYVPTIQEKYTYETLHPHEHSGVILVRRQEHYNKPRGVILVRGGKEHYPQQGYASTLDNPYNPSSKVSYVRL